MKSGKKQIRKIVVDGVEYIWTIQNMHALPQWDVIRVHKVGDGKSVLYLDATAWHFEIRPNTIAEGILFAHSQGWMPEVSHTERYISFDKKGNWTLISPEDLRL